MTMTTSFFQFDRSVSEHVNSLNSSKEYMGFVPVQRVEDKEISSTKTPEQASAIIMKRMAKAVEEEFERLKLEV